MGDITLSTGITVKLDMSKITFGEWRKFFKSNGTEKDEDDFIAKITGIKSKEVGNLLRDDVRRIILAIVTEGTKPLDDPNAVSPSTSD
jgi:hypothetical protein